MTRRFAVLGFDPDTGAINDPTRLAATPGAARRGESLFGGTCLRPLPRNRHNRLSEAELIRPGVLGPYRKRCRASKRQTSSVLRHPVLACPRFLWVPSHDSTLLGGNRCVGGLGVGVT